MIAPAPSKLMTIDDLRNQPNDGNHYELVKGELVTMPPPGEEHGTRAGYIAYLLLSVVLPNELGRVMVETGYYLTRNPDTVRSPDVSFVRRERYAGKPAGTSYREGAPDLAVEIVSPGDTLTEVLEKVEEYLTYGARLIWVIEAKTKSVTIYRVDRSVQVLRASANDTLSGEDVIPGFSMPVATLFIDL